MLLTTRLLAATGAITLAAGLATAPSAFAGSGLAYSNPRATPTPYDATTGVRTDACNSTTTPGWIGLTTGGPTLSVDVQIPGGVSTLPNVAVTDETTSPYSSAFLATGVAVNNGTASVQVPNLADGHSYSWRAYSVTGGMPSASLKCHFRVDTTAPTVSVDSTDFPASGSGVTPPKYAGQTGTFTIKGADAVPAGGVASGVACYAYGLAPTSPGVGWHCGDPGTVAANADGSASIQLRPKDWGTNSLSVQAMDTAGNVSQPFSYSFYAPWNPNPPQALGDVDNDGAPDIVLSDAGGNLQVINGTAGTTVPSETVPAVQGVYRTWAGTEIAHRGWVSGSAPADEVFIRVPGSDGRSVVYSYTNYGSFQVGQEGLSALARPTSCLDVTGAALTCPTGFSDNWYAVEQMVALGSVDAAHPKSPTLLTVEHGDLWLLEAATWFNFPEARQLTTSGAWSGYDLVAPGPDAQGNLALWARDRATGQLHVYPLPKKADGTVDFSSLADPTAGVVADGFTTAAYPTLGSSGDLNGDGTPDLYAVTADRHLVTFSGYTTPKDLGALK